MSVVHRVIVLNKPFKIRGYTIMQWLVLGVCAVLALFLATKCPQNWKFNGAPVGVFVFVIVLGAGIAYVSATQMKPGAWWRNKFLYTLGVCPTIFLPKREEAVIYPDPTIIDHGKREDNRYITIDGSTD